MGLDMYINREKSFFFGTMITEAKDRQIINWHELINPECVGGINLDNIQQAVLIEPMAYWRKANQIHYWFVKNIQNDVDDCKKHSISKEQFETLLNLCIKVLGDNTLAKELLPTQKGFFFGSDEYNQDYFNDLHDTVKQVTEILTSWSDECNYYYSSSW